MNEIHKLIIIGSGPAGLTAAIYASRAGLKPLIIDGKKPGGQLMGTTYVENWPGIKSILGPDLMKNMKEHAEHFGTKFQSGEIVKVDFNKRPFKLWTDKNLELQAQSVVIATGAIPNRLNCPGEEEYWGKGVTTCAICDGAFYKDMPVIVVGGGDTAMENASFLARFTKKITIVQIEDKLTASKIMQDRVLENPDIKIIYNSTITKIEGDQKGINQVTVTNKKTNEEQKIEAKGVFVSIGLHPGSDAFKGQLELDKLGYIVIKNHTKTSVEGVFAAGDVVDYRYRQAVTSAGTGCMAALDAEKYLQGLKQ